MHGVVIFVDGFIIEMLVGISKGKLNNLEYGQIFSSF